MASQEFLASFAVEIDESGVSRLQQVLEENRELAERLSAAFSSATAAIHTFAEELGILPGLSSGGITSEGMSGFSGLTLGLDTSAAEQDLQSFIALAKKPVPLSVNASGVVSAARSAYISVKSIFSVPVTITARVISQGGDVGGDSGGAVKMSTGGRFTKPTDVQVAEDGDAEYIIPVKKEDRAVPLLRQLLSELSPTARESLGGAGDFSLPDIAAGTAAAAQVTWNNSNVSAPVTIQVHASGADAERIGRSVYDTAERYLLRTLKSVRA
ncbi:MAG: hypothetical protein IKE15_04135 [Clostridia bacterium]|nr:hypothetical protein [Clostridia bacterium]